MRCDALTKRAKIFRRKSVDKTSPIAELSWLIGLPLLVIAIRLHELLARTATPSADIR